MPIDAKRLTKHFPKLAARDRFRLIMAARQRGDEAEKRRLVASAPHKSFQISHDRGYSEAFLEVMGCHVMFQLDIGVHMWKSLALVDRTTEEEQLIAKTSLRLFACLFLLRHEAWQMLGEEYGFDGRGVQNAHPASASLRDLEATAIKHAFTREEAKIIVGGADADVVSAESLYEDMKEAIEARATWWM